MTQVSEGTEAYITAYTYDALSNLTCVEQHGGVTGTGCSSPPADDDSSPWRVRRFTYDSLSRLLTAKNPETGTITYGYNADSVLTTKTDNRGMTVTYTPEPLHRVSTMVYSDSTPTVTNTYDAYVSGTNYGIGRRTGMSDGSGSTTFTYDKMGRIWTEQQTIGTLTKSTSNVYNLDGSVAQTTYPSGAVIAITPGGDGRPVSETDTTHSIDYAKSLVYAPPGEVSTALYGYSSSYAGITQTNSYNSRGQPVRLQACGLASCTDGSGSGTPYLMDLSYNYGLGTNDNGNVLGITNNKNTARNQTFTYDPLNRLLTAQSGSAWGINFTGGIDAWGNLAQTGTISGTSTNPMSVNQSVNGSNQFTLLGYSYDAAGNVLTDGINTGCGTYGYAWDAEERMTCGAGATYTYNGDGVRVEKTGGSSTPTLYWGSLAESDTSGNLTSEYIFLNGKRIARRDVSGAVYYYFSDHLGSSNVVATSAGAVENESDFYPFGGENKITLNLANQKFKFTGKERDTESGNDYFGARYYASSMGRWMSPDWSAKAEPVPYAKLDNPQSLNLYAYLNNNPLRTTDPDGHDDYDGKVHVTANADGTKTATQGTQTSTTSTKTDASGNVSTTTTTTKSMTTVTLDAHGDVSAASSSTTTSSQTVNSKGDVTSSSSSTSTSTLDEHSGQVTGMRNDAISMMQMKVTDLVPKTWTPAILDHFHITGQDVLDGIKDTAKGLGEGASSPQASWSCVKGGDCN